MSNEVETILDLNIISDSDFDFLCDTALNLVFETLNLTEADEITLNKINERLNSDKYDLNVELDMPNMAWWQEDELPELLNDSEEQADNGDLNLTTLELNVISITTTGSHAGERVVVASIHVDVPASLQNIESSGLQNLQIKWLPELDN